MKTRKGSSEIVLSVAMVLFCLMSCSKEDPVSTTGPEFSRTDALETSEVVVDRFDAPDGLVDVTWQSETLRIWPYTGNDFSGAPQDPMNLVFVGRVDPVTIRAALMSLDGNRPGFPPLPIFGATWSDAVGNVQTGYADGGGWTGAVVQLELGSYSPMRIHLRLVGCSEAFGSDGGWTLGAAHFEINIPSTADHQVLSWELAEKVVVADLKRSGLLDPASGPTPTGIINQTPSFHDIPAAIYNGVPDALKILCELPPGPSSAPVPIPTDGRAMILHVGQTVPVAPDNKQQAYTMSYGRIVPKPICSDGPLDFILLEGPVNITKTVRVDALGRYQYASDISGRLTAVAMDVTRMPPVPVGEPFMVLVSDQQGGVFDEHLIRVTFDTKRLAPKERGVEKQMVTLHVSSDGANLFRSRSQCLGPDE